MAVVGTLVTFSAGTLIKSSEVNSNFADIKNAFNASAVLTDTAKTITVAHTFSADILFTDALYDIGKSGATRPRDGFFSRNLRFGVYGTLAESGTLVRFDAASGSTGLELRGIATDVTLDADPGAASGTKAVIFRTTGVERGRFSGGGILLVGAAIATNAAAGEVVLANAKSLRGVNAAGTDTKTLIELNATDQVVISSGGQDIKWGKATVALGGGAAPTVGTIGGSGPAAAAQTSWLRVIDSGGTARFIPLWT